MTGKLHTDWMNWIEILHRQNSSKSNKQNSTNRNYSILLTHMYMTVYSPGLVYSDREGYTGFMGLNVTVF